MICCFLCKIIIMINFLIYAAGSQSKSKHNDKNNSNNNCSSSYEDIDICNNIDSYSNTDSDEPPCYDTQSDTDSYDLETNLLPDNDKDISDGRFLLYNYKLLSNFLLNINKYKCPKCKDPSGYKIKLNNTDKWSVGTCRVIDLYCSNCNEKCSGSKVLTSPWLQTNYNNDVIAHDIQNKMGRPSQDCLAISNILLQLCCLLGGNIHGLSKMICGLYDIQSICNDVRSRTNNFVADTVVGLSKGSMNKHLDIIKDRIKNKHVTTWDTTLDDAWFAVAKRNCSVAYGFLNDVDTDKFIGCEVMSRLPGDCRKNSVRGIDEKTTGSRLGTLVCDKLIDDAVAVVQSVNDEHDLDVGISFTTDNDNDFEPKFEQVRNETNVNAFKKDDINHALGKIYRDKPKIQKAIKDKVMLDFEEKIEALIISTNQADTNAKKKLKKQVEKLKKDRNKIIKKA
eukprot:21627_1